MNNIIRHANSRAAATALAGVFALVSVQNIAHFFVALDHPAVASWTLGIAIGCALVVLAHQLSGIDTRERKAFYGLLAVTSILVALSGIIQGVEYAERLGALGYLLAFVLAATGEIVLPLAVSWQSAAERRQSVNDAGQRAEELAAQTLIGVMSGVDVTRAHRQAERRLEQLVIAHVDHIVAKLMPATATDDAGDAPEPQSATRRTREMPATATSIADMNVARSDKAATRRSGILALVRGQFDGADVANFKDYCIEHFDVSKRTIERDLAQLESAGLIVANGVVNPQTIEV